MGKITGSLQEKNGQYYACVNLYVENKRKVKWINLDVPVKKGNKKQATDNLEKLLAKLNAGASFLDEALTPSERDRNRIANSPLEDYVEEWLEGHKRNIANLTYEGYKREIKTHIRPYFENNPVKVKDVTGDEINAFYDYLAGFGLKGSSQQRYHAVLHEAFRAAVKRRIIPSNPVEQAERPKSKQYIADFYNSDEIKHLIDVTANDELHLIILITAYYGLRRSEVLGLKWSAIDFTEKRIVIKHKVIEENAGTVGYDVMKTKSSYRTLPLLPIIEQALLKQKEHQDEMKKVFKKAYSTDYEDYVNVDALGRLYKPDYITNHFKVILKNNGLRIIRFHDLRHSCASLLLANDVSLKVIQEWLGHSDIQTTANIYSHLDAESKRQSAAIIGNALAM